MSRRDRDNPYLGLATTGSTTPRKRHCARAARHRPRSPCQAQRCPTPTPRAPRVPCNPPRSTEPIRPPALPNEQDRPPAHAAILSSPKMPYKTAPIEFVNFWSSYRSPTPRSINRPSPRERASRNRPRLCFGDKASARPLGCRTSAMPHERVRVSRRCPARCHGDQAVATTP